jgi:glycosyltransferase involved in cell wall biosynthesis
MKVLVLVPDPAGRGGVVNYYNAIRPHLPSDVEYLVRGSRHGAGRLTNLWHYGASYLDFARTIATRDFDLIHLNTSLSTISTRRDALYLILARLFGKKVVVFFRGWSSEFACRLQGMRLRIFRETFLRAHGCIVLGDAFHAALRSWGYRNPVFIETTAVDTAISLGSPFARVETSERNGVTLLFLSRIEQSKGIFTLLEAFQTARARIPGLRLVVAGDGRDAEAARRLAVSLRLADVEFIGHVSGDRKLEVLRDADLFVLPTNHAEGMPNSVLEAMCCGLPVITRPMGGIPDFFQDGRMGLLMKDPSADTLSGMIVSLAADTTQRIRMGTFNKEYARARFGADAVARRLERIYRRIVAGAHDGSSSWTSESSPPAELPVAT